MSTLIRILFISIIALLAFPVQSAERTTRIVGGTEVPDLRYPWVASIYFRTEGDNFSPKCGGTLISDRWILSAAHCFSDGTTQIDSNDVAFLVGALDLRSEDGIFDIVSRIIVHPGYQPQNFQVRDPRRYRNDIALLELAVPLSITPITIPSLANPVPEYGERATVAGWGATSQGGSSSALLQEVDLPIVDHNACLPFYDFLIDQPIMVCAGGSQLGGRDSCQGDSGGPLFVPRGNRFVQAGIVSFGDGCAQPGIPGVYTRVAAYFDWISSFVGSPRVYSGADDDDVIAVADPVEVLTANSRVTASVSIGDTNIYQVSGIDQITLETLQGDADLYVFNSADFSIEALVCSADGLAAIDECLLDTVGNYFIAVAGYDDSDYALSVNVGGASVVDVQIVTLQLNSAVSGSLLKDTAAVYRATTGNTATLTSVSGDADLLVFSSEDFSVDTLICASNEGGSALDSCNYSDTDAEVFIGVYGFSDASFTLEISSSTPVVTVQTGIVEGNAGGGGGSVGGLIALLALLMRMKYRKQTTGYSQW